GFCWHHSCVPSGTCADFPWPLGHQCFPD
nr:Chain A, Cyclic plant protein PDP-23 [Zinnia elegans]7L51_B Chain B, Cyclic plant protein PDP-23 [Zinnia elegans]7L53_A Chain A, Cyclic plant protein PDP-23 [Zinnia elegans]7L54_A Chain A, Cyclic plant protein PDP-23 [Zinnia elegans]7L55_A Chain A, Cyclic plant protein PDP-23 [Zinnia elegans]7MMY_A Chain A, PDP-23 [Zinnia elegans]7MMY_B Chain B, PDP-23 [Zinnia elegans]